MVVTKGFHGQKAGRPFALKHSFRLTRTAFIRLTHSFITLDRLIIPAGISHHGGDGMILGRTRVEALESPRVAKELRTLDRYRSRLTSSR